MNDLIESIYGVDGGDALEKAAQVQFIEKLASEYDVDLNDLTAEQLEELEAAVQADIDEGGMEKEAGAEEVEVDVDEEELEKVAASYDAYGRVMAHGFMEELEKTAGAEEEMYVDEEGNEFSASQLEEMGYDMEKEAMSMPAWMTKLLASAKGKAGKAWASSKSGAKKGGRAYMDALKAKTFKKGLHLRGAAVKSEDGLFRQRAKQLLRKGALQTGAAYGAPAALAGGGGYAMYRKGKKKKSSALDTLAEERANEILGMFGEGMDKVASDEELDDAVTLQAFNQLAEAGYPVDEMIDALGETE